jgi:AraC-like DNA-binding protein
MTCCCARKSARAGEIDSLDRAGYVDPVAVERATRGQPVGRKMNRNEIEAVVVSMSAQRRWGLALISQHTGMSRSQVAAILAKRKRAAGG